MGMRRYITKRIIISLFTLFLVATLNFFIFVIYPGDPAKYLLQPGMKPEQQALILAEYGLNETLSVQYVKYLRNLFTFGIAPPYFGVSFETHDFVAKEMSWRLSLTLLLLGSALIGRIIVGIPTGILAASKRGSQLDVAVIGAGLFTWGVPTFFIQLLAILFFVSYLNGVHGIRVFPGGGVATIPPPTDPLAYMVDIAWHATLPAITLVIAGFGSWALYTRNLLIEALTQDYVITARAKGLKERTVLYRHAFRGILPPIATMITLAIPGIVTGAIITETIFGWNGIGKWYIDSLNPAVSDYPVVQAVLYVYAVLVVICNFIADILYGILDPRIRT